MNHKTKKGKVCHAVNNAVLFVAISAVMFTLVYFTIKEGHRVKIENELLAYEVW